MKTENIRPQLEEGVEIKPVVGFEGLYEITNDGRVWSVPRVVMRRDGKPMKVRGGWRKATTSAFGYRVMWLMKSEKKVSKRVACLVAEAFLGPLEEDMDVDHIDRDRMNDKVSNLRFVTRSRNLHNNGAKGFHYVEDRKKWHAQVTFEYKNVNLGYFETPEEARAAYIGAKRLIRTLFFSKKPLVRL